MTEDQEVLAQALREVEDAMTEKYGPEDAGEAFHGLWLSSVVVLFRQARDENKQHLADWLNDYLDAGDVPFRLVPVSSEHATVQ